MIKPIKRLWLGARVSLLLVLAMLGAAMAQAAGTQAGTLIKNMATVLYEDSYGNKYQALSNESVVVVAEIYDASLTGTQKKSGAPGQTVYFQHQLINKGNTADRFDLKAQVTGEPSPAITLYQDTNGNGQPDAGEPQVSDITVNAGTQVNLIAALMVPTTAPKGTSYSLDLTATAKNRADSSTFSGTVKDTLTVVSNTPVLVVNKALIKHTPATLSTAGEVTYRITVKNTGDATAGRALIYDFLPKLFTGIKDNISSADTRLSVEATLQDKSSTTLPAPLLKDTTLADYMDTSKTVVATITGLKAGETVSLSFTATYNAKAGENFLFARDEQLLSRAYVVYDTEGKVGESGDIAKDNILVETNEVITLLPGFFGLDAVGVDTDKTTSTVASAESTATVVFPLTITNKGNSADRFKLNIADASDFPTGTGFSYWDATGSRLLEEDTTAVIPNGQTITVMVKASLPEGGKATPSTATLNVTSVGDPTKKDTVNLVLSKIEKHRIAVDLAYKDTVNNLDNNADSYNSVAKEGINIQVLKPGEPASFSFAVHNESAKSQSFSLMALGSVGGERSTYVKEDNLPAGWTVTFLDDKGQVVSSTPMVPAKGSVQMTAVVTVPTDAAAVSQQPFAILAQAANTADGNDALKFFATINPARSLTLSPDGNQQVEPGGVVYFDHQVRNTGNVDLEKINLTLASMSEGWSAQLFIVNSDKNLTAWTEQTIAKGTAVTVRVKVMAPANVPQGFVHVSTLTMKAFDTDGAELANATATETVTVIKGQIRLYKKVAVIAAPADDAAAITQAKALKEDDFQVNNEKKAVPGKDYIVWQIIARNEGDADAKKVEIKDAVTAYTTLAAGDNASFFQSGTGQISRQDDRITFYAGTDATATQGGTHKPGESVEVRFVVKVN